MVNVRIVKNSACPGETRDLYNYFEEDELQTMPRIGESYRAYNRYWRIVDIIHQSDFVYLVVESSLVR